MCNLCGNPKCEYELRHYMLESMQDLLSSKYPKLQVVDGYNVIDVYRGDKDNWVCVLMIILQPDSIMVRRSVPRYESLWETIKAADPDIILKTIEVLEGKRPIYSWPIDTLTIKF